MELYQVAERVCQGLRKQGVARVSQPWYLSQADAAFIPMRSFSPFSEGEDGDQTTFFL